MGGTASTRRVTFEADENENITVVKGIRVSDSGRAEGRPLDSDPLPLPSLGPAQPGFPRLASLVFSCPKPSCLRRSLKFFTTWDIHSEIFPRCVPSAGHCAGAAGGMLD